MKTRALKDIVEGLPDGCLAKRQYQDIQDGFANCIEDMEYYAFHDVRDSQWKLKEDVQKYHKLLRAF